MKLSVSAIPLCFLLLTAQVAMGDDAADRLLTDSGIVEKSVQTLTAQIHLSWQTPGQPMFLTSFNFSANFSASLNLSSAIFEGSPGVKGTFASKRDSASANS